MLLAYLEYVSTPILMFAIYLANRHSCGRSPYNPVQSEVHMFSTAPLHACWRALLSYHWCEVSMRRGMEMRNLGLYASRELK
jgi:hypothetical protein